MPEGLAYALARKPCVGVPVELAHEFASVPVPEVEGYVACVERGVEHVPGVPAEVVAGGGVEVDVAEPDGCAHSVPVMASCRRAVVAAA